MLDGIEIAASSDAAQPRSAADCKTTSIERFDPPIPVDLRGSPLARCALGAQITTRGQ
jgi:hypothetical protein